MSFTNAQTGGENVSYAYGSANGNWTRGKIEELVTITKGQSQVALTQTLPARSRIIAASIRNVTDCAVTGTESVYAGPTGIALICQGGTGTNIATCASNATTYNLVTAQNLMIVTAGTSSHTAGAEAWQAVEPIAWSPASNVAPYKFGPTKSVFSNTNAQTLLLIPFNAYTNTGTSGAIFLPCTETSKYQFATNTSVSTNTYASVAVCVHYETFAAIAT